LPTSETDNVIQFFKKSAICLAAFTLLGCGTLLQNDRDQRLANHDAPAASGADSCSAALSTTSAIAGAALDPADIRLFVWNMHKGTDPDSMADLNRLASGKNLVLIQEARLERHPADALTDAQFWSFAPGYRTAQASTGVMTLSNIMPVTHCNLTDREPWLGSPKAISITKFNLAGTDETLAVVNVHALNFTFGVRDFSNQIEKIKGVLAKHAGPVILAGDFNTWRARRFEVLRAAGEELGLNELTFDDDQRVTPMGSILDRIFVRGLDATQATIDVVDSSDHNPMSVTLRM
jgi:endonuclease/exonuclease/phosphatase (EEP) superfamily protein YafD